jgi:hypothetical protein
MRSLTIRNLFLFATTFIPFSAAVATSFVYPAGNPTVTPTKSPPAWLPSKSGDDGYITVRADVKMPPISCAALGKKGLIGGIFAEKMQIVASIKTVGFRSNLDGQSLPVATFDGRNEPGACTGFNTLPATIISYARLEPFSVAEPGALAIIFDVKSTTDKNANLVSSAQLVLGTAAVFTTGGAATTVAGLTAAFAKPALANLEQKIDKSIGETIAGQARIDLDWLTVRTGIGSIVVPVYAAKTGWGETSANAIKRVRNLKVDPDDKLFDVVLTFSYTKTLFDTRVSGVDDLPQNDALASNTVLNHPRLPGILNFMQLLNSTAPSLLQVVSNSKTNADKAAAAGQVHEVLKSAGLNLTDRAIVMKSFIDEAQKGTKWYSPIEVNAYFGNFPEVRDQVTTLYGAGQVFGIPDTQVGMGPAFVAWKKTVAPILNDLRQALTTTEAKANALANFNGGADIEVSFYPSSSGWVPVVSNVSPPDSITPRSEAANAQVDVTVAYPPGITKLASATVKKAGCFVYGDDVYLAAESFGGHMIVVSEAGEFWRLDAKLAPKGGGKISNITLSRLSSDWKNFFQKSAFEGGECPGILSSL